MIRSAPYLSASHCRDHSIILAFAIGYFFWWSGKNGQFDDLEGPAHRILMDDDSTDKLLEDETTEEEQESEK